jgi:3-oxoacyl-[acyl-carrier protein] reductase
MTRALIDSGIGADRIPAGRAGTAGEIAQAVMLVVNNGYITGQTISVNGGASFC